MDDDLDNTGDDFDDCDDNDVARGAVNLAAAAGTNGLVAAGGATYLIIDLDKSHWNL